MSKHDAYLTCDCCGKTVAEITGWIFKREEPKCGYIKVPHHYVAADWLWGCPIPVPEKGEKHICDDCLKKIVAEPEQPDA